MAKVVLMKTNGVEERFSMVVFVVSSVEVAAQRNAEIELLLVVLPSWKLPCSSHKETLPFVKRGGARNDCSFIGFRMYSIVARIRSGSYSVQGEKMIPPWRCDMPSVLKLFSYLSMSSIILTILKR